MVGSQGLHFVPNLLFWLNANCIWLLFLFNVNGVESNLITGGIFPGTIDGNEILVTISSTINVLGHLPA